MAKRRQNGEGTIYQRPNGLWVCDITIGYDENKKRIKKTFSSMDLDKLKKKLNEARVLNDRSQLCAPSDYTVYEWINLWLKQYKQNTIKPTTYDSYYHALNNHINPNIGNYKLDKLTPIAIQMFVNNLAKKGLSASTIKTVILTLSQSYKKAIELKLLTENPCNAVDVPKRKKKIVTAFTQEEQTSFLNCCKDGSTYQNLFVFAFYTGMRMGEIIALTWDDIDLKKNEITVNKNITRVYNHERTDGEAVTKMVVNANAKTDSSARTIPLAKAALTVLKSQQLNAVTNCPFIFPTSEGGALNTSNIRRSFDSIMSRANIKSNLSPHSIRHSFATRLLEKGADIKTVSELLGHKSIQITLDTYSHVSSNLKKSTIDLL